MPTSYNPSISIAAALKKLSHARFLAQTDTIYLKLSTHPLLKDPPPPPFPNLEILGLANEKYRGFYHGALNGDRVMGTQRDLAREDSTDKYVKMYSYLHTVAGGDSSLLLDTGFPVTERRTKSSSSAAANVIPGRTALKHGDTGVLVFSCARVPNAAYDLWICTGDPTVEQNWQHYSSFNRSTGMEISGRQPGQRYYVRVRYVTSAGNGPFSAPISLISM